MLTGRATVTTVGIPNLRPGVRHRRGLSIRGKLDDTAFVHVPLTASQTIFFDPRLVHRSGPNRTDSPRIGLNIRYATADGLRRGTPDTRRSWMFLNLP
jgi:ectoine hydroxylase-related dioxygenase (phytanoyl-CoA dioxygenase family)